MALNVAQVMTRVVTTLRPEMTLKEMDRVLLRDEVSGAPVVENGRLVGVASQSDVVKFLYQEQRAASRVSGFYSSPFPISIPALEHLARDSRRIADEMISRRVRDVMSPDPLCVGPDDEIGRVAELMVKEHIHRVPVQQEGRLVGIVSTFDLARLVAEHGLGEGA